MQDVGGIPPGLQRLCYGGKNLEDPQRTLEQCVTLCHKYTGISCTTRASNMLYMLKTMQALTTQLLQVRHRLLAVQIPPMAPEDPKMCALAQHHLPLESMHPLESVSNNVSRVAKQISLKLVCHAAD